MAGQHSDKAAMTVDVEEYFQVEAFSNDVRPSQWQAFESRLRGQIDSILEVFDVTATKATFFTLGWIAEHHPQVIKDILAQGHELGSHGYMHQHLSKQNRQQFSDDIRSAKARLEDLTAQPVVGFRAPCFSISADNEWAHDEILAAGYRYSSSSYPINHDLYGVPLAPRHPYYLENGLLEIPVTTTQLGSRSIPIGGGGYFRLLPYWLFMALQRRADNQLGPINFYTHPWEFDPKQPRIKSNAKSSFRHHVNQGSALSKLQRLCGSRQWLSMSEIYLNQQYPTLSSWQQVANGLSHA
ncbi:XrtA system polysaccharide deacetylase [Aliagarivorans marinus]|uniref:XrtA system polysaccharide deacetylase n=1 Tax=Aliagarivorans marinus TaxID=561965 RepID=UPI00041CD8CC|nr:XrtA system polysaccharide deacetylase [Aliagarivorans marinus]